MITIKISGNFDIKAAVNFVERLYLSESDSDYIFDYNYLGRVTPFAMLFLVNHIKAFMDMRPFSKYYAQNYQQHSYLSHMGFFQACRLAYGNLPGQAAGGSRYLPITNLTVNQFHRENPSDVTGGACEMMGHRLAKLLLRESTSETFELFSYSIREMLRNVLEHSETDTFSYCAQYWPSRNRAEIAILDNGIGIRRGLQNNPFLNMSSHKDAVQLAVLPGVSGKMYKGVKSNPNNAWENSGFGLFVTSKICNDGGEFFLCSGDAGLHISQGVKTNFKTQLVGTAIGLNMDTSKISTARDMIRNYVSEGDIIKKQYKDKLQDLNGEKASMMISEEMRKALMRKIKT